MSWWGAELDEQCGVAWPHWRDDHDCVCARTKGHAGPHRCDCGAVRVRFE